MTTWLNTIATAIDLGQDIPWTVLADPEGSEFCLLTPG